MLRGLLKPFLPIKVDPVIQTSKRTLFITSIGNPEPSYEGTRHNAGHRLMNQLIEVHWKDHVYKKGDYYLSLKYPNLILFKSNDSLMNVQGRYLCKHLAPYPDIRLIVLHDELQRDVGKFQVRGPGTSTRGHNGLKSIDKKVGQNYTKLGIGIGRPQRKLVVDYVMEEFTIEEVEVLDWEVLPRCAKALEIIIEEEMEQMKKSGDLKKMESISSGMKNLEQ